MLSGRRTARVAASAEHLAKYQENESRVADHISSPEAARVLGQSEQPLQAYALHPGGRLPHAAGVEIEGGADSQKHRRIEHGPESRHPVILFGRPETNPHDISAAAVDLRRNLLFLRRRQWPKRRR